MRYARSAGFPACGFWRLSSRQFPHGNTGLESPVNPQTGMSALQHLALAVPLATSDFRFKALRDTICRLPGLMNQNHMSNYLYEAVDAAGLRSKGSLEVLNQNEALRRIKEMGLFPTMVRQPPRCRSGRAPWPAANSARFLYGWAAAGSSRRP